MKKNNQNDILDRYLRDYWEYILRNNPTFATYIGDHRYNDELEDLSEESFEKQTNYFKEMLTNIEKISEASLSPENRLNLGLLKNTLTNHVGMYRYKTHYLSLNQLKGAHIDFPQIIEFHPFKTRKDLENYEKRLHSFPRMIEQIIELMNKGIHHNITAFNRVMEHVRGQVDTFKTMNPEDHPLFQPVLRVTGDFSEKERADIKSSVREVISSQVTPAYNKLSTFLDKEYRKHCREREGIWSLPDGDMMYRFYVKYHTTTELSPEEIHKIGLSEVKRIGSEIEKIMQKIGFRGGVREFAEYLKGKRELYLGKGQEILDGYRQILSQMDKTLPRFFKRLPRAHYDVKEIEPYRQRAAPAAYYYPPPQDFSRPGYFYVNTFKPEQRDRFTMEALAYHEAVPGHHLQIAIMQEQRDMPDFRRYEGATAFVEGWALYAEKLAQEMGFYHDDYALYGRLTFEIWRAVRLVVDTGLHFYQWSRDRSIQYSREHTGLEDHEIKVEIDRYIAMPGQALAYKLGELKILELRERSRKSLGSAFRITEFHDRLLENGALPLSVLEQVMNEWMSRGASV